MNLATYARRNLFRRRGRTIMTIIAVTLAVLIFCAIRTFIVDDGALRMTTVKLGPAIAGGRELVTSIPPGTKVVLDPPGDLTDGQEVKENKR